MVDFNTEATISTPAIDIMRVQILEARHNLLNSIEIYKQRQADGHKIPTSLMKSRLWRVYQEIEQTIQRHSKPEEFEELETFMLDDKDTQVEKIMFYMNIIMTVLDTINLTRIDTKQKLGGNLKGRNKSQGWES